jgi:L-alanine-DL-glutamate epimerase-like enolase superfamily enzyme
MQLAVRVEKWPYVTPFRITDYVFTGAEVVVVTLDDGGLVARGEGDGVYYRGETPDSIAQDIESARDAIEAGASRQDLQTLLPPGGARNALDCAMWELDAKRAGKPVWELAGLPSLKPLLTTFTVGVGTPEEMAATAKSYVGARAVKVKLTPDNTAECIRAVRAARPDVWLGVDANRGFTRPSLEALMPVLKECDVSLIEQPFALGHDGDLEGFQRSIPIAADESVQSAADLKALVGLYDAINIKLDKCGGLTEGLHMAHEAKKLGFKVMVGCMSGTSLAMAPAFVLGQLCDIVDLDAPTFLSRDREHAARYVHGEVFCPEALWGSPSIDQEKMR